jgi:hypothetical protein
MTTRVAQPADLLELAADQPDLGHSPWRRITQGRARTPAGTRSRLCRP